MRNLTPEQEQAWEKRGGPIYDGLTRFTVFAALMALMCLVCKDGDIFYV